MMKDVARRLFEKGIAMAVTEAALDFVLTQSFDLVIKCPFETPFSLSVFQKCIF